MKKIITILILIFNLFEIYTAPPPNPYAHEYPDTVFVYEDGEWLIDTLLPVGKSEDDFPEFYDDTDDDTGYEEGEYLINNRKDTEKEKEIIEKKTDYTEEDGEYLVDNRLPKPGTEDENEFYRILWKLNEDILYFIYFRLSVLKFFRI